MARSRKSVDEALSEALREADSLAGPFAVAFSGGLDSTVLLHAAARSLGAQRVLALHVHHGLQPQAPEWVRHCEAQAHALGVAFRALYAQGAPARGDSVEQWARAQRYALLLGAARETSAAALLTAHHADDQLETLLLALSRGCGLDGLTGIAARDRRDGVRLLRPLLEIDRAGLAGYAHAHGLRWVDDPSNLDESLPRNAVRARVLPALRAVLPQLAVQLPDALSALREARETVDAVAAADLEAAQPPGARGERASDAADTETGGCAAITALDRRRLVSLPPARQTAALRAWLVGLGTPPPSRSKAAELREQLLAGSGAHAELSHSGWRVLRHRDRLCAVRPEALAPLTRGTLRWQGEPALPLPGGGRLLFEPVPEGLDPAWLRARELRIDTVPSSERLRPDPRRSSRTLKNLRQEAGVPSWLRGRFPGVWVDARLLLAAPFGMDRDPRWPVSIPGVVLRWAPDAADTLCSPFVADGPAPFPAPRSEC
jgi:tRNA(Ile)-lysidine synthase